jgi:HAE1 family hydrophobic/amphiphilic exporter-1
MSRESLAPIPTSISPTPESGAAGWAASGAYTAQIQAYLKPRNERALSADDVARELRRKLTGIPGVEVFVVNPPTIRIGARQSRSSYQYTLQGLDLIQLRDVSAQLETALKAMPGFVGVSSDFDKPAPSVEVGILRDRAAALGVTPTQIENALGYAFGGQQVSQIYGSQNLYLVVLELLPQDQRNAAALNNLYVTSSSGTLVPLSAVTKITSSTIPVVINHQGELPAVTLSFDLASGYALSDAVSGYSLGQPGNWRTRFHPGQLPGHRRGLPAIHPEYGHAAVDRDHRGLHHPGHPV